MRDKELNYVLNLLDYHSKDVFKEINKFYYEVNDGKRCPDLSENIFTFLKNNLIVNPVTTCVVLSFIQSHSLNNKHNLCKIQEMYMEVLKCILFEYKCPDKLIALISLVRWDDETIPLFVSEILLQIPEDMYRQHKKQILISLVPHQRPELLKATTDHLHKSEVCKAFKLVPEYMLELCYKQKVHWLLKGAQVYKEQLNDIENVSFRINNFTKQILIMVLIDLTNSPETSDLQSLVRQLTNVYDILDSYTSIDDQLQFYMIEIKRELSVIKFCMENNCKIAGTSIFSQALSQSALAFISKMCPLSKIDRYKVSRLLNANKEFLSDLVSLSSKEVPIFLEPQSLVWDILIYNSYCAVTKTIDTIFSLCEEMNEVSSALGEVQRIIMSISPIEFCMEVIENVFACLFLRHEYFTTFEFEQEIPCSAHSDCSYFARKEINSSKQNKKGNTGFICNSLTTQVILNVLKSCLENLELSVDKGKRDVSVEARIKKMVKIVNHSVWKLQLVSNLSPEISPFQFKLCLDYVEIEDSSEDENSEVENKIQRKKFWTRRRNTSPQSNIDKPMITSSVSEESCGSSGGTTIDFISVMLAKPNSLVALALYHNDFARANQIIEMFDLADTEIATEVTFTEQLRHFVAKLKNIVSYEQDLTDASKEVSGSSVVSTEVMSYVETFLATNRSPNSVDVNELALRYPHLQLYCHQNTPFINAADILLSSGLNREISYGLINVVERKLSDVRKSTDTKMMFASAKRLNYIRFVEDVTSITFEILGGNNSFEYANSVCAMLTDSRIPIRHKEFGKMNQLAKELKQACNDFQSVISQKETDDNANSLHKYHQIFMNIVSVSDKDIFNIGDVSQLSKKTRTHYLRMCYMYCKTVSQLERNDAECTEADEPPYFSILDRHLHEILGDVISRKDVPVTSLEPVCKKLNVDLLSKLIMNFCPPVALINPQREANQETFNTLVQAICDYQNIEDSSVPEPSADFAPLPRPPDAQCLTYIVIHNWVLAHIIKKIHSSTSDHILQSSMDARTKCLNNYMELRRFECLSSLFGGNKYIASLHTAIDLDKLFEIFIQLVNVGKLSKCLNILEALTERQVYCSANLLNLRDLILFKMATNDSIENNWKYCLHIKCPVLKVSVVFENLSMWSAEGTSYVLDCVRYLNDKTELDQDLYVKCTSWIRRIPIYDQISVIMGQHNWHEVYKLSVENQEKIIGILMDNRQFKLCLEWADEHNVSEVMKNLIVQNLLGQLFESEDQPSPTDVQDLLFRLPVIEALDVLKQYVSKLKNLDILEVCVQYLTENSPEWESFGNIKIGLQIMKEISPNLRPLFWDLIENPLLMIEQFLMNAKLDILTNIIEKISPNLKSDPRGDNLYYNMKLIDSLVISRNSVNALLRCYAEKALDMKNQHNTCHLSPKQSVDSLLLSIDSINLEPANKPFVMPEQVPTKDQWVEDYSTDRCMVCSTSIFSMIIRRHHCRRCGRLVCHDCSKNKMQVDTYPSGVKFRVCTDCFTQSTKKDQSSERNSNQQSSSADSVCSRATSLDWCLSACKAKNEAIRVEFSYEFIPNVTLCLSIMKMHSIDLDYPRFLLDRSEEVTHQLSNGGDVRLLVRARRSLLLAAAELYSRLLHQHTNPETQRVAEAGAGHVARCLAVADTMATLVRRQAHHLVPQHGAQPGQILRVLLEAEEWDLALEIATKSGLSRTSVLAAWGKACLKAGCFKQAREKFALCFKTTATYTETTEECEYGREASESHFVNRRLQSLRHSERTSTSSVQSEGRVRVTMPLLSEIIELLEDMNYPVNQQLLNKAESIMITNEKLAAVNINKKKIPVSEPALNIMHMLASIKKIRQADYSDFAAPAPAKKGITQGLLRRHNSDSEKKKESHTKLAPFFCNECIYYLSKYGSHAANIAFYMKYNSVLEVLKYCYDNGVDKETFTESVYMECYKRGPDAVEDLLKAMTSMDSTLNMWADYIMQICRSLEASRRLEALYAVQCGSGQEARAAATCARLYARSAPAHAVYATLLARERHLVNAIHHLEACVPVAHKMNDPKSFQFHLDKATISSLMTTISRQIELARYLAACEASGQMTSNLVEEVIPIQGPRRAEGKDVRPLTLFGSNTDKIKLVAAVLVAGKTVEESFNLAFKIITEHKLDSMNIYTHVAKYLVATDRFMEVKTLAKCIRESKETAASLMSDQVLEGGVAGVVRRCEARGQLHDEQAELLIADVHSLTIKITCYLVCKNLSNAYILAARNDRTNDLRRILQEAERVGNEQVRNACLKRLTSKNIL